MVAKISVLNIGVGNTSSVIRMIELAGGRAEIIDSASEIIDASKLLIPGVGSFDYGMKNILDRELISILNFTVLEKKVPVLGICLGMQLMCKFSEEGSLPGLGWIDADVRRFKLEGKSSLKIPHMGWNTVRVVKDSPLISSDESEQRFYFVHSFHVVCNQANDSLMIANHGYDFTAAFSHENIFGVQFHPEKSHKFGLALMKKFVEF
jgi:glutamine amidotransferase